MRFNCGFRTDIGRKRANNQDAGIAIPEIGLFIVSDGMGGHQGGAIASITAVDTIAQSVRRTTQENSHWQASAALSTAFTTANHMIYSRSQQDPQLQGMGTTTVALLFQQQGQNQTVTLANIGDSRCYFFRPHAIWQLSQDHSLVQEKLRAGLIQRSELKTDRMKNVITRSVGFEKRVEVDLYEMSVQSYDTFLLCSDGLSGMIDDLDILAIIDEHLYKDQDAQKAVDELTIKANHHGGEDNITSVLIQVLPSEGAGLNPS